MGLHTAHSVNRERQLIWRPSLRAGGSRTTIFFRKLSQPLPLRITCCLPTNQKTVPNRGSMSTPTQPRSGTALITPFLLLRAVISTKKCHFPGWSLPYYNWIMQTSSSILWQILDKSDIHLGLNLLLQTLHPVFLKQEIFKGLLWTWILLSPREVESDNLTSPVVCKPGILILGHRLPCVKILLDFQFSVVRFNGRVLLRPGNKAVLQRPRLAGTWQYILHPIQ